MKTLRGFGSVSLAVALTLIFVGCTHTTTPIAREGAARPRIEQTAFSAALESAYKKIDMSFCRNKNIFVETKALAQEDIEYITSYVTKLVIASGGRVVLEEASADIKMTSFLEVTGTDEVARSMKKDVVVGQVKGTLTLTDIANKTVTQVIDLRGIAQTKRNKDADTKILE